MSRYVIRWGDGFSFDTVPAHTVTPEPAEITYVSKGMAITAAVTALTEKRVALNAVITAAQKRLRRLDRQLEHRESR